MVSSLCRYYSRHFLKHHVMKMLETPTTRTGTLFHYHAFKVPKASIQAADSGYEFLKNLVSWPHVFLGWSFRRYGCQLFLKFRPQRSEKLSCAIFRYRFGCRLIDGMNHLRQSAPLKL